MPYLHPLLSEPTRHYIEYYEDYPQNTQIKIENPLLGHKIVCIESVAPSTEMLILKNQMFNKFVSDKSPFSKLDQNNLSKMLEKELGIENVQSSSEKAHILSLLQIKEIKRKTIVLEMN